MLKKKNRLKGKEVNFLFKKQKIIPGKFFSFLYYKQYPNNLFNKLSTQIPLKVSKKAVKRNLIKRSIYGYIQENSLKDKKIGEYYYKVFIVINKKTVPLLKELVENKRNSEVRKDIRKMMDISFKNLYRNLGKVSSRSSTDRGDL